MSEEAEERKQRENLTLCPVYETRLVQIRLQEYQVRLSEISLTKDQQAMEEGTEPREETKAEGKMITGG